MRSRARYWKAHPIHPMLLPFPLAFLMGALGFDLLGRVLDTPTLWMTGGYLAAAGVLAGLVAAVPGLLDYLYTVPPESSAETRATRHMAVNLDALGLFGVAWAVRMPAAEAPTAVVLILEAVGAGLLAAGGRMGGTLVCRNQIGVDHRYAGAGKWHRPVPLAWLAVRLPYRPSEGRAGRGADRAHRVEVRGGTARLVLSDGSAAGDDGRIGESGARGSGPKHSGRRS